MSKSLKEYKKQTINQIEAKQIIGLSNSRFLTVNNTILSNNKLTTKTIIYNSLIILSMQIAVLLVVKCLAKEKDFFKILSRLALS